MMKGALYDQRRHRIDIFRALSHCANNIIADMEGKMKFWMVVREGQYRRKRLYPADEQSKRDEYFRDIGLLKMDEKRLRQKRNFELWCEGRDKEMT